MITIYTYLKQFRGGRHFRTDSQRPTWVLTIQNRLPMPDFTPYFPLTTKLRVFPHHPLCISAPPVPKSCQPICSSKGYSAPLKLITPHQFILETFMFFYKYRFFRTLISPMSVNICFSSRSIVSFCALMSSNSIFAPAISC